MLRDINSFLNMMENILSYDIIKDIINIIYKDFNISIVKRQKLLKYQLNKDIIRFHNTYYYDKNYLIYKNNLNQMVLKQKKSNTLHKISLYSDSDNSSNLILNDNNDEIILFTNQNNIKLYVMYT